MAHVGGSRRVKAVPFSLLMWRCLSLNEYPRVKIMTLPLVRQELLEKPFNQVGAGNDATDKL